MRQLLQRDAVFVTGKGGVGKTTFSASLARWATRNDRRVLLVEIDTDAYLGRLFGDVAIGFDPVLVAPGIHACTLHGDACMAAFVQRFVGNRKVAELILGNKVAQVFFRAAPSVMEAVIMDQLATLLERPRAPWDLVIVDLPASGHAVTLLNVPRSMVQMVRVGELAQHMGRLAALFADARRAELVLVSLPEEMSVNETIELWHRVQEQVPTRCEQVVLNGLRHSEVEAQDADRLQAWSEGRGDAAARVAYAARIASFWTEQDAVALERLETIGRDRIVALPYFFDKEDDQELTQRLAHHLERLFPGGSP